MKLIIDIETRLDTALINSVQYPGQGLSDAEALVQYQAQLKAERGSNFVPVLYHVPISIAAATLSQDDHTLLDLLSFGRTSTTFDRSHEEEIVERFWGWVSQGASLVTWNGRSFDLPVLELHALKYRISSRAYWQDGSSYRYRFKSDKHDDLSDYLSSYGATSRMSIDGMLKFLGFTGKGDVHGSQVQAMWEAGRHDEIAAYCRRDVLQTWVIYLHVEHMRGRLTEAGFQALIAAEADRLREIQ